MWEAIAHIIGVAVLGSLLVPVVILALRYFGLFPR